MKNFNMVKDIQKEKSTYYTHGFHPYPAKFTPQLVNNYLKKYCNNNLSCKILDPFCGSGTSILESVLNGFYATGIDLNPIATLISKAKTHHYSLDNINTAIFFLQKVKRLYSEYQRNKDLINNYERHNFKNISHWFQENVIAELSLLKNEINKIEDTKIKDLTQCAFSKIIVKVSNQDSEVRYTAKNKNHQDGIVFSSFIKTLFDYIQIIKSNKDVIKSDAVIYTGDTLTILKKLKDNKYDFIITSPPYINTFDYYLYHKQRMFWLDFDPSIVRKNEIGNHHKIDSQSLEKAIEEYKSFMTDIFIELSRISKVDSIFVIIIGDGIVKGNVIDMSNVISDIASKTDYSVLEIKSENLSNITRSFNKKFSNAEKKEHYIVLKNIKKG